MARSQERFAADLDELYDEVMGVVRQALNATKQVRVSRNCKKCGCKHIEYVAVEDVDAAMKAAAFLADRGAGRPAVAEVESGGDFVVQRFVVEPVDDV